ncbi:rhomboid family intramembrane serine protease [Geomonas sp. RF6]|uniref:rhomboid family intramembrane serine protease n=1 Tax=Geomonas sp. RF6 TaxID=2897342 RepID=UPI001E561E95|nr:rhomboid family intramembrane serine protease [Geomonas sp. RF6]UFS69522.1 rhomboid family intramembrane serine protease [Geomonas sp. RF6]
MTQRSKRRRSRWLSPFQVTRQLQSAILCRMEREIDLNEEDVEWLAVAPETVDRHSTGPLPVRSAKLWSLVLEARYLPARLEPDGNGWRVMVPAPRLAEAERELRLFVEENRHWPPSPPPTRPQINNALAALSVLLLVATFYNVTLLPVTLPDGQPLDWLEAGSGKAGRILDGEWWRLITALTLHADLTHLFSNLAIGGIFIVYLCSDLGSGLAWALLLSCGALGNLANAYVQLPSHDSIGSSTLVFAAVGVLGASNMVRHRHHALKRWPLPVAAALSLLVLLGTEGKNTDLGAHLFGFLFGVLLGAVTAHVAGTRGRPGTLLNVLLALLSIVVVVGAWWWGIMAA